MTSQQIYEKYQHLDHMLSDRQWLPDGFVGQILYELWAAVRDEQLEIVQGCAAEITGVEGD